MRLFGGLVLMLVAAFGAGFALKGPLAGLTLALVALVPWVIAVFRGPNIILSELDATSDRAGEGIRNTLKRVEEHLGPICETLVVSSEPVPDALFFRSPLGGRCIVLSEGLLRCLQEAEIRSLLVELSEHLRRPGLGRATVSAVWSFWIWRRVPAGCRAALFHGHFPATPAMNDRATANFGISPFQVMVTLILLPWVRWFAPRLGTSPRRAAAQSEAKLANDNAMRKASLLRMHLELRRPTCWDALSLFRSDPLLSAFEMPGAPE